MSKFSTEEIDYKEFDWRLVKRLFAFIKPYIRYFYFALFLMLLTTVFGPIRPYLSKIAIDKYVMNTDANGFLLFVFAIFTVLLLHSAFQFLANYLMKWLGQGAIHNLRNRVFQHLLKLDISFFDKNTVGRLVTRVTNDIETISDILSGGLITIITDLVLIFSIIAFMFYLNIQLTLLTLSVLPVLIFVTMLFRNKVRKIFRLIRKNVASLNSFINEFIAGILTIKIFNREGQFNEKFDIINKENKALWVQTISYFALFFPTIELLSAISLGLIIWFTAENILSKTMTIGTFFAFIQYAEMFYRPIRDLSEKFSNLQNAMASSERIFQILDTPANIETKSGNVVFDSLKDSIEFRNVSFSYDGENEVLHNVSFKINKGETIALVGHTGAGKSTIVNLLCRFYDVSNGEILIDGININDYNLESLRKKIAFVSQDVFLFSRKIIDNLSLGSDSLGYDEIVGAAKEIGSLEFIDRLPEKFDTNVIEKGITLSAGQKQLIALTRALIRNPEILILDEATSNIDPELEKQIVKSTYKLISGRTSIVIAHRFSTIQKADRIIVLHKGRIKEVGRHTELLQAGGLYAKLFRLQFEYSKSYIISGK
ncbi:MAG: ABC transporter ATP-binding protein [Candidatus Kapaibacteriota bacterium]